MRGRTVASPIRSQTVKLHWCLACPPFQTANEDTLLAHVQSEQHRRRAVTWLEKAREKGLVRA